MMTISEAITICTKTAEHYENSAKFYIENIGEGSVNGQELTEQAELFRSLAEILVSANTESTTNGGMIRHMSDEELVGILHCDQCIYQGMPECGNNCKYGILAWLKQESYDARYRENK